MEVKASKFVSETLDVELGRYKPRSDACVGRIQRLGQKVVPLPTAVSTREERTNRCVSAMIVHEVTKGDD